MKLDSGLLSDSRDLFRRSPYQKYVSLFYFAFRERRIQPAPATHPTDDTDLKILVVHQFLEAFAGKWRVWQNHYLGKVIVEAKSFVRVAAPLPGWQQNPSK